MSTTYNCSNRNRNHWQYSSCMQACTVHSYHYRRSRTITFLQKFQHFNFEKIPISTIVLLALWMWLQVEASTLCECVQGDKISVSCTIHVRCLANGMFQIIFEIAENQQTKRVVNINRAQNCTPTWERGHMQSATKHKRVVEFFAKCRSAHLCRQRQWIIILC